MPFSQIIPPSPSPTESNPTPKPREAWDPHQGWSLSVRESALLIRKWETRVGKDQRQQSWARLWPADTAAQCTHAGCPSVFLRPGREGRWGWAAEYCFMPHWALNSPPCHVLQQQWRPHPMRAQGAQKWLPLCPQQAPGLTGVGDLRRSPHLCFFLHSLSALNSNCSLQFYSQTNHLLVHRKDCLLSYINVRFILQNFSGCNDLYDFLSTWSSQVALVVKNLPAQCRRFKRCGFHLWVEKIPLEEDMATHSSILAWRIPCRLQSIGSQRVRHD